MAFKFSVQRKWVYSRRKLTGFLASMDGGLKKLVLNISQKGERWASGGLEKEGEIHEKTGVKKHWFGPVDTTRIKRYRQRVWNVIGLVDHSEIDAVKADCQRILKESEKANLNVRPPLLVAPIVDRRGGERRKMDRSVVYERRIMPRKVA